MSAAINQPPQGDDTEQELARAQLYSQIESMRRQYEEVGMTRRQWEMELYQRGILPRLAPYPGDEVES